MKTNLLRVAGLFAIGWAVAYSTEHIVGHLAAVVIPQDLAAQIQSTPGLSALLYSGLFSLLPACVLGAIGGLLAYPLLRRATNWLLLSFAMGAVVYTHLAPILAGESPFGAAQQFALLAQPSILAFYATPLLTAAFAIGICRRRESHAPKNAV